MGVLAHTSIKTDVPEGRENYTFAVLPFNDRGHFLIKENGK